MKNLLLFSTIFVLFLIGSATAQLIKIDGQKDAFYDQLTGPDDGKLYMPAACYIPSIGPYPSGGNADISGIIWTCWDNQYLYYYAEVTDDTVIDNNASSSGSQWSNDKIEVKYDPDPSLPDEQTGAIQTGLSALDTIPTNGLPAAEAKGAVDNIDQDGELHNYDFGDSVWHATRDDFARRKLDHGYALEWRIPFNFLNKGDRLFPGAAAGTVFGTTINIADNDSVSRTDLLQWSAGHVDEAWSYPRLQGQIQLLADNKVSYVATSPLDPSIVNDSAQAWYYQPFTDVKEPNNSIPGRFSLLQNYPNPFNPSTNIGYNLGKTENVTLIIYNITGEEVKTLVPNVIQGAGNYHVTWNGKDNNGREVSSGVYFYRLKYGTEMVTKKMMLLR